MERHGRELTAADEQTEVFGDSGVSAETASASGARPPEAFRFAAIGGSAA
jgi:hypothetical protein